jgi:hypothetical protein
LKRIEQRTGAPVARQIRMAVDRWLGERGKQAPALKQALRTGSTAIQKSMSDNDPHFWN